MSAASLRLVVGDQLSSDSPALLDADKARDVVLMVECDQECGYVPHHKQKIVLFLSAMRHFAAELRADGYRVDYVALDDPGNSGSLAGEVARAIGRHGAARVVAGEPGEWRLMAEMSTWAERLHVPVELREDHRFLCSRARFAAWAKGRRTFRMEHFYRDMRRLHGLLMEDGGPAGGAWNFDAENRKRLPAGLRLPQRRRFAPDAITQEVIDLVQRRFPNNFGTLDTFGWPVTRAQALEALDGFIADCLPHFGDYQDAMKQGQPFLFHALLAPAINLGLLSPLEVCRAAEEAWRGGQAPLNAAEGFIRQILGWREYVRGIYWTFMPDYAGANELQAARTLPGFYWTGETDMNCVRQVVCGTRDTAYSHHIQRLMVTGNFALLAGVAPHEIERWYLAVYADAIEWVEMPNTLGMAVFADGGRMASKPYAASGAYINRMSDFCSGCHYDVALKSGPRACPFNYLYWAFLIRNEARLAANPRMAMPYRTLSGWSAERRQACVDEATRFLDGL